MLPPVMLFGMDNVSNRDIFIRKCDSPYLKAPCVKNERHLVTISHCNTDITCYNLDITWISTS